MDESWARRVAAFQDPALDTILGNVEECKRKGGVGEEDLIKSDAKLENKLTMNHPGTLNSAVGLL